MKGICILVSSILVLVSFSSCSGLKRHADSGYFYEDFESLNAYRDTEEEKRQLARSQAAQQLGISAKSLAASEIPRLDNRVKLNQLERLLATDAERSQYYYYRPFLRSDAEKIAFLSKPSMAARENWAQMKDLASRATRFPANILQAIEAKDVVMGMSQNAVLKSWGDPLDVAIAGRKDLKNEIWTYRTEIPTVDGYLSETRILYFEAGRVVGWEKK